MALFKSRHSKARDDAQKEMKDLLMADEQIEHTFPLEEEYIALTSYRVVLVDQSLSGGGVQQLLSLPYSRLTGIALSRTSGGKHRADMELLTGSRRIRFTLFKKDDAPELYKALMRKLA